MKKPKTPAARRSRAGGNPVTPQPAASQRAPTYDDLLAIARLIESGSRFSEFRLKSGDIEVEVKRANGSFVTPAQAAAQSPQTGPPPVAAPAAPGTTSQAAAAGMTSAAAPPEGHLVKAPMVGTFYRSPAPDKPPFVEVGTRVKADTIVCIIEVMKLMNSVTAGVAGVVTHVLAQNAQPVEAGQPVIAIKPQ
jgi:acetyl-CoA carboxylase biotin carboxyl carrier protein